MAEEKPTKKLTTEPSDVEMEDMQNKRSFMLDLINNAHELQNMDIAHEIALNDDFKLSSPEKLSPQKDANKEEQFANAVKEIMHKAFWDSLEEDLTNEKPSYKHAFILLEEIKSTLLSFLPPNRKTSMHAKIESLDVAFLRQQADNGALNVSEIAFFIVEIMSQLCSPVRDAEISALRNIESISDMFKKIYEVLDLMKIDMANFAIKSIRPYIQKHHVDYERSKFALFVQKSPDGLRNTRQWLSSTVSEISSIEGDNSISEISPSDQPHSEVPVSPMAVLSTAYINLLQLGDNQEYPETVQMDKERFKILQKALQQLLLVLCALIHTSSIIGTPLSSHRALMDAIKVSSMAITTTSTSDEQKNITEALNGLFLQIWKELTTYVEDKDEITKSCLDTNKQEALRKQILLLKDLKHNQIYCIMYKRAIEHLKAVTTAMSKNANTTMPLSLPSLPTGFNLVADEINQIAVQYAKLVNLNKAVYGPFYVPILRDILGMPEDGPETTSNAASTS